MTRAHGIGSLAAIGGLTAMIALLVGPSTAKADELADLQANQQLLQQRIDQLAQAQAQELPQQKIAPGIPPAMGTEATPGRPLAGGSFPRSFLIPGTDTSIRVGGFVDITMLDFLQGGGAVPGSNNSSNAGQNGNLHSMPVGEAFIPGVPGGVIPQSPAASKGNGVFEFSSQQSRINIETRTPTAWGESRTFFEFDWSGCNNDSCQALQQSGGDSMVPRLRFAYGTLGGFLAGQAISNFSDADADTESMDFGGIEGSTGGNRIPQVRYTIAGPYGSAFSVSAEQSLTSIIVPGGTVSSDLATPPTFASSVTLCNGVPCTVTAGATQVNPAKQTAPNLTIANYWSEPWGHVDFAGVMTFPDVEDGAFINEHFIGYGGHFAGDVHPDWFGWHKDDFLFSFVAGTGIGNYLSGGENTLYQLASNDTVTTACAVAKPGCTGGFAASNILFKPISGFSTNGGYQHWWTSNLRSTVAIGEAQQYVPSQLVGPIESNSANKILWDGLVNLVWNPVAFITTGVQYMYGKRVVVSNASAHENVLVAKFRVAF
ncbi:MAG TPA: DcaP family trimeric outer membrane transporter [Stellaceae bacterium]|nr:DcaP family trimeric outer membrane transporter [Stellaceae bacterium]